MAENVSKILDYNRLFDGWYAAVVREKMPKINIIGHFLSRTSLKLFSDCFPLNKNMIHLMQKLYLKNVHNRR